MLLLHCCIIIFMKPLFSRIQQNVNVIWTDLTEGSPYHTCVWCCASVCAHVCVGFKRKRVLTVTRKRTQVMPHDHLADPLKGLNANAPKSQTILWVEKRVIQYTVPKNHNIKKKRFSQQTIQEPFLVTQLEPFSITRVVLSITSKASLSVVVVFVDEWNHQCK